jgi:hypothetical protein
LRDSAHTLDSPPSLAAAVTAASRLAVSIWLVGDVRREVKAPRPAAS